MPLSPGARIGSYGVLSALGAGGMGEVYRARDARLGRDVALKIIPDAFSADPERLARFQREAKTLASLNHPNIAQIYGVEELGEIRALVMELVEGPTLAELIAGQPAADGSQASRTSAASGSEPWQPVGVGPHRISINDALPIARQIAGALVVAHEQGIVHRDLKPANIKVRDDGTVKVLDFGLAKAAEPAGVLSSSSQLPTITTPAMTQAGIILGTAAYMSPEQAKGKPADKRSDVWAFGCVLYEMVTGKRAYEGEDIGDTLAAILRGEPDWAALPGDIPLSIRTLLTGCLTKDRRHRVADLSAALFVIDHQAHMSSAAAAPMASLARVPSWRKALLAWTVVIVALAAGYAGWRLRPVAPRPVTRLAIVLAEGDAFTLGPSAPLAVSPDGTRLVYAANERLYLRALDQLDAAPIAGVEAQGLGSARSPFFSSDGRWVGFWEAKHLKKVSVSGGAPITLCPFIAPPYGVTWAADNTILIGHGPQGIWRMSGEGGEPQQIIKVDAGQRAHGPQLLPDGRTVLFTLAQAASWDEAQIVVQSLDNGTRQTLVTGGTDGRYLPTGHVVYALRGTVLAVPFDVRSLSVRGEPVPLVEGVWRQIGALSSAAQVAVSSQGTLAYVPPPSATVARQTLVWVDRLGHEEAIPAQPRSYRHPRLAPDGTRLALEIQDDNLNRDIWVWDFQRGTWTRITTDPSFDREPVWTPDSRRVIFSSMRTGTITLFWQSANGTGQAERLSDLNRQNTAAPVISPDARHLVIREAGSETGSDLMILDLPAGPDAQPPLSGQARPLVQTPFEELNAEISPDGRWLAYQSNSSGVFEIYVRPFPDVESGQWLVSTAGGTEPLWARDGRELFYRSTKGAVMRVVISPGTSWTVGTPTQLFEASSYVFDARGQRSYDVSHDGKRFMLLKNTDASAPRATAPRIVVVQNWFEELKARVPVK